MSRRRVSVKDLGKLDCVGWLYKKKENKGFLGTRWKKYWFVLKGSSLYWYASELADKAEGYINVTDFTISPTKETKKKHAVKASHSHNLTLYFAAENLKDTPLVSDVSSQTLTCTLTSSQAESEFPSSAPGPSGETHPNAFPQHCQMLLPETTPQSDEMERLYLDLKQANLSPTGLDKPFTKRDYRSSFIRRCKDEAINEKLHVVRTLNSTLKAKEADLLIIEQVLEDPSINACKYRKWREDNVLLMQEILQSSQSKETPSTNINWVPCYTETSV
uniref:PH domain-containing protein n=1 Tax=Denticeps clupeoides TaxID=299321 RepID=A0AAY4C2Y1_9TELE